jgi:hypothetical protein
MPKTTRTTPSKKETKEKNIETKEKAIQKRSYTKKSQIPPTSSSPSSSSTSSSSTTKKIIKDIDNINIQLTIQSERMIEMNKLLLSIYSSINGSHTKTTH